MKKLLGLLLLLAGGGRLAAAPPARPAYFELKVYHLQTARQEALVDSFLRHQYLPALHAAGRATVGVFKPIGNDTAADRRVYVLTPYASLAQREKINQQTTAQLVAVGGSYENAPYDQPAYKRLETILIQAFPDMGPLGVPRPGTPPAERVYELRSYESASEKLFRNKVRMFNAGGEIKLFDRLGFHAVFYGSVVFGAHMPNLMYLTTFENQAAREAHWQAFGADPEWKKLSALPEYQHNVSHIDIVFLHPTPYSDL